MATPKLWVCWLPDWVQKQALGMVKQILRGPWQLCFSLGRFFFSGASSLSAAVTRRRTFLEARVRIFFPDTFPEMNVLTHEALEPTGPAREIRSQEELRDLERAESVCLSHGTGQRRGWRGWRVASFLSFFEVEVPKKAGCPFGFLKPARVAFFCCCLNPFQPIPKGVYPQEKEDSHVYHGQKTHLLPPMSKEPPSPLPPPPFLKHTFFWEHILIYRISGGSTAVLVHGQRLS